MLGRMHTDGQLLSKVIPRNSLPIEFRRGDDSWAGKVQKWSGGKNKQLPKNRLVLLSCSKGQATPNCSRKLVCFFCSARTSFLVPCRSYKVRYPSDSCQTKMKKEINIPAACTGSVSCFFTRTAAVCHCPRICPTSQLSNFWWSGISTS